MANPAIALNPNDPIVQALQAEAVAEENYNSAGYHRNFLEQKAKKGDEEAKTQLPEAQRQVEEAQERLKRAQTYLAQLTGTPNPHAKQKAPRIIPNLPKDPSKGEEVSPKKTDKNLEVAYRAEKRVLSEMTAKLPAAHFESSVRVFSLIKFVDRKGLREEIEKILNERLEKREKIKIPLPQNGEMMRKSMEYLQVSRGESAMVMEHRLPKVLQGVKVYLNPSK